MYLYQTSQEENYRASHSTEETYRTTTGGGAHPMDSDLMDMLGMPQSGATWNKQFDSGQSAVWLSVLCVRFIK